MTNLPSCKVIVVEAEPRCPDATWLFGGRNPDTGKRLPGFYSPAESFTTALFALYLLFVGEADKAFPVRRIKKGPEEGAYRCPLRDGPQSRLDLSELSLYQLGIERHGKADLIIRDSDRAIHIENKPWAREGEKVPGGQILDYRDKAKETKARFCVLLSCCNDQTKLWEALASHCIDVLLWEEVLLRMDRAKFPVALSPSGSLSPYYQAYVC